MVTRLRYGNTNTFFVHNGSDGILIDTDWAGTLPAFFKAIKDEKIQLNNIKYVMATHYHPDHMGLISELMSHGVKLIIFDVQSEYIHYSDEIFSRERSIGYQPIDEAEAMILSCDSSRSFLLECGINGEVIHTAGHSNDSISLLLDEGIAIVGDLDPIDVIEAYGDNNDLKESWAHILKHHPKIVYYAHANERHFD